VATKRPRALQLLLVKGADMRVIQAGVGFGFALLARIAPAIHFSLPMAPIIS